MMVLYSGTTCPFSHRCRFVLFEKGMDFEIRDVDLYNKQADAISMRCHAQQHPMRCRAPWAVLKNTIPQTSMPEHPWLLMYW